MKSFKFLQKTALTACCLSDYLLSLIQSKKSYKMYYVYNYAK